MAGKGGEMPGVDPKVSMAHMPIPKLMETAKPADLYKQKQAGPNPGQTRAPGNFSLFDGSMKHSGQKRQPSYQQQGAQGYSGPAHPGNRRMQGDTRSTQNHYGQNAGYAQGAGQNRVPHQKPGSTVSVDS